MLLEKERQNASHIHVRLQQRAGVAEPAPHDSLFIAHLPRSRSKRRVDVAHVPTIAHIAKRCVSWIAKRQQPGTLRHCEQQIFGDAMLVVGEKSEIAGARRRCRFRRRAKRHRVFVHNGEFA